MFELLVQTLDYFKYDGFQLNKNNEIKLLIEAKTNIDEYSSQVFEKKYKRFISISKLHDFRFMHSLPKSSIDLTRMLLPQRLGNNNSCDVADAVSTAPVATYNPYYYYGRLGLIMIGCGAIAFAFGSLGSYGSLVSSVSNPT